MNYYETLYIVHPALESGRLKDIILSIQNMFESKDIKVLGTDLWGKKKLAYLIDKQNYGTYVLVQLESSGENINKISTELEHNPDVLAYLTSKIDESSISKDFRSLDEQILGSKSSPKPSAHPFTHNPLSARAFQVLRPLVHIILFLRIFIPLGKDDFLEIQIQWSFNLEILLIFSFISILSKKL